MTILSDLVVMDLLEFEKSAISGSSANKETLLNQFASLARRLHVSGDIQKVGQIRGGSHSWASDPFNKNVHLELFTRLSNAYFLIITSLTEEEAAGCDIKTLLSSQSFFNVIFTASGFLNPDPYLQVVLDQIRAKSKISDLDMVKVFLLYSPSSSVITFENVVNILKANKRILLAFVNSILSSPLFSSEAMHNAKKKSISIFCQLMDSVVSIEDLSLVDISDIYAQTYMYSTYINSSKKHELKAAIHETTLRLFDSIVDKSRPRQKKQPPRPFIDKESEKKIIIVFHEPFASGHSMYRSYGERISKLSMEYELIGVCNMPQYIDDKSRSLFHKHFVLNSTSNVNLDEVIKKFFKIIKEYRPSCIYVPSVGMDALTPILLSFPLCEKIVLGLGHPAPTMSKFVNHVIYLESGGFENDLEIDTHYHYEGLSGTNRNIDSKLSKQFPAEWNLSSRWNIDRKLKIAVSASIMKINYDFLVFLNEIFMATNGAFELQFFLSSIPVGSASLAFEHEVQKVLKSPFSIHCHSDYGKYSSLLSECDIFITPFPFGNTNTLSDYVSNGLIGYCLRGDSFSSNTDALLFKKLGLADFVCESRDEYRQKNIDLINSFRETNQGSQGFLPRQSPRQTFLKWSDNSMYDDPSINDLFAEIIRMKN